MGGSGTTAAIAEAGDGALVGRAQLGDGEAYAELYRRHYPAVLRACTRRLGHRSEAEEVAQAAFVRGFERIELCAGEQRFGAWMQVIARRMCADAARARARARAVPCELTVPDLAGGSPEEHALRRERLEALRSALDRLPRRQRQVLVARDVEGRRPTEIAAALGLSLGAVDSLLLRARRALAAGYRAMVAEQGVVTVASSAVATATGSLISGPQRVWRSLARGLEAAHSSLLDLGGLVERIPSLPGATLVAGVVALSVVVAAPPPEPARERSRPASAVPGPADLTTPVPGHDLAAPLPAAPAVPPPDTPPVPSQRQFPPARPNPLGEALGLVDVEAAADAVVLPDPGRLPSVVSEASPVGPPARPVPSRPGRAARQTGREAWNWSMQTGRETGREVGREVRAGTRPDRG